MILGSELEDEDVRALNHFHEPISNTGLDDWSVVPPYHWTGNSNLAWASGDVASNQYSWPKARAAYHAALVAKAPSEREQLFTAAFRTLGHVLHLIEDLAVPAHTRNDMKGHIDFQAISGWSPRSWFGNNFEAYVEKRPELINAHGAAAVVPSFAQLSDFWDTDAYDGGSLNDSLNSGLAEYSSANFVSTESMFDEFPHPALTNTNYSQLNPEEVVAEDGKIDNRLYVKSINGERIEHLASVGYLASALEALGWKPYFVLDEECHKEYASKLIPKAIGYTAGVANYFFRGSLEISRAALGAPHEGGFSSVTVAVRNATPGEDLAAGELMAVVRYKADAADSAYSFAVSDAIAISALSAAEPEEFTFALAGDALPAQSVEAAVQVIFKGTLGAEEHDAVAVGMKQLPRQCVLVQASCSGITMALVWDIVLNQPADIRDAGGQAVSFPCDSAALAQWKDGTQKIGQPLWNVLAGADSWMQTLSCAVNCYGASHTQRVEDECAASNSTQSNAAGEDGTPYTNTAEASATCASGGPMPNPNMRLWTSAASYHIHASATREVYTSGGFRLILDSPAARMSSRNNYPVVSACFRTEETRSLHKTLQSPGLYDDAGKVEEMDESASYTVITPLGVLATLDADSYNLASVQLLDDTIMDGSNSGTQITDGCYGFAHAFSETALVQIYAAQSRSYSFFRPCGCFSDGIWVGPHYNGFVSCPLQSQSRSSTPIYIHAQCDYAADAAEANPLGFGRNSGFEQDVQALFEAVLARVSKPTNQFLPSWTIAAEIRE